MTQQFLNLRRCVLINLSLKLHTETLLILALKSKADGDSTERKKERKKDCEHTRPLRPLYWESPPHSGKDLQNTAKRKVKVTLTAMTSAPPDGGRFTCCTEVSQHAGM